MTNDEFANELSTNKRQSPVARSIELLEQALEASKNPNATIRISTALGRLRKQELDESITNSDVLGRDAVLRTAAAGGKIVAEEFKKAFGSLPLDPNVIDDAIHRAMTAAHDRLLEMIGAESNTTEEQRQLLHRRGKRSNDKNWPT